MSVIANNIVAGAAGQGGAAAAYQIDRSLRLNSSDTSYLSKTFSSDGDRRTNTISFWIKKPKIDSGANFYRIFGSQQASHIYFYEDKLFWDVSTISNTSAAGYRWTNRLFRDPSAWYHIVAALDTTQGTPANRMRLYVNGVEETSFQATANVNQNDQTGFSQASIEHTFGYRSSNQGTAGGALDAYLADVHFIDGQALAATDFGETDSDNNWNPKAYSGTYGTNGFHLDFSDNSSNAALGDDSSGNNNDWTVNNLTAGHGSTVWSNNFTSGNPPSGYDANKAFDGSSATGAGPRTPSSGAVQSSTLTGVTLSNSTVKIGIFSELNSVSSVDITAGNQTSNNHSLSTSLQVFTLNGCTGNSIQCAFSSSSNCNQFIAFFEIDGEKLVNPQFGDSLLDSPTNYDDGTNVGGNYATLNPLQKSSGSTLSNGNLDISMSSAQGTTFATMAFPASGKWYFECTANATQCDIGIAKADASLSEYLGNNSSGYGYYIDGNVYHNNASAGSGASYTTGDIIGVAFDADAGTCKWYKNNALQVTVSSLSGEWFPAFGAGSAAGIFNFGARPFAYTPPSNHLPLVTTNLTDPTIADGSTAMDAKLYTGNGSTNVITGLNFGPDLVWIKNRTDSTSHMLFDTVRGVQKVIYSNATTQEQPASISVTAFNSDGFTVGSANEVNGNNDAIVAWTWDGGTTTATNTDGSITSNVRANQSAGFSICKWTGSNTNYYTVGHGLNAKPDLMIFKQTNQSYNWHVYHSALGATKVLRLNLTNAELDDAGFLNDTEPTSSVFTTGNWGIWDANADTVGYFFTAVEGYSAFGSYTGNGSSDGPFVFTGFRPAFVMLKRTDSASSWQIRDTSRSPNNVVTENLYPNLSNAESTDSSLNLDILSNGFKPRTSTDGGSNASGGTYIYAAFAEHPFKTARAR